VPGDHTPANQDIGLAARQRFVDVLDLDPKNSAAISSIARLAFQQQSFDEARLWYGKLADSEPKSAEAYYMLGVIGWAVLIAAIEIFIVAVCVKAFLWLRDALAKDGGSDSGSKNSRA